MTVAEPDFLHPVRTSYDAVAGDYAQRSGTELAAKPLDRAMLAVFAELVQATGPARVADLGCGPGHVTAHLDALGLTTFGVDLSPRMVAQARRAYPDLRFDEGSMTALDLPDGTLGGVVALYSIIHTPPERLPEVFAEFRRVLAPGGHLLIAFQVGDEQVHMTEWLGTALCLDVYWRPADRVAAMLGEAGLVVHARLVREPDEGIERRQRAYLLARRPTDVSRT